MKKRTAAIFLFVFMTTSGSVAMAFKREEAAPEASGPEAKADEIHRIAASDMIYAQEEVKALYYQNVRIIELLGEIRDLLKAQSETSAKLISRD